MEARLKNLVATPGRRRWWWWSVVGFVALTQFQWWWRPGKDASAYLSIANSLSEGGLANLGSPFLHYPVGYSVAIAPLFWVSDRPFLGIALFHTALLVGAAWWLWGWMRRWAGRATPVLVALTMVNVNLWFYGVQTLSETLFLAALLGCVTLTERVIRASGKDAAGVAVWVGWTAAAAGATAGLALIRPVAFVLPMAAMGLLGWAAARGRASWPRAAVAGVVLLVPAVAVVVATRARELQMQALHNPDGITHESVLLDEELGGVSDRLALGGFLRISGMGRLTVPGMHRTYADYPEWLDVNQIVFSVWCGLLVVGWWRLARRRGDVLLWTWPVYLGLHLWWPADQGTRYLVPMLPVLIAALWGVLRPWRRHRLSVLVVLTGLHAGVTLGFWATFDHAGRHGDWAELDRVAERLPPGDGPLPAVGLDDDARLMLRVATDRFVNLTDAQDQPAVGEAYVIDRSPDDGELNLDVVTNEP